MYKGPGGGSSSTMVLVASHLIVSFHLHGIKACYRDSVSSRRAYDFLPALCTRVPVHIIWGAIDDSLYVRFPVRFLRYFETPFNIRVPEVKAKVTNATSGRRIASVTRVEEAGHLVRASCGARISMLICNI